ncbi:nuclear transport factor 2 family protein [Robiginitalea aurantiaca]|uniref:Nuclear transport factor 2 family protein n=1 Tax=Robiginitalea aurantiaca TaxID=3056915 RepID=A0ABT7WG59_9FLAO|nr:nuclear transport factor 2 family protein [Robiginitalea aurantiaca]MDM9631906.1 nuclear transport factor 2 family protein [Robiginitalea aurantiaca]
MKTQLFALLLLVLCHVQGQSPSEEAIKSTIEDFFEGFHKRDTSQMRSVLSEHLTMQRIGKDADGIPYLKDESIDDFLTSMASLPDTLKIEERLHSFTILTDGAMAEAWTPYSLYVQGTLHHCGVNSFQLFHDGNSWKIIYLVDTRQVTGCPESE